MTLVRFNSAMPELTSIMNNFFDRSPFYGANTNVANKPAVNIGESEESYFIEMALPGYKKEDFKIEVNNHVLTISAQMDDKAENNTNYKTREFAARSFSRSFNLHKTHIDDSNIEGKYENGVLTLTLAKREEAKPKPARLIDIA